MIIWGRTVVRGKVDVFGYGVGLGQVKFYDATKRSVCGEGFLGPISKINAVM